MKNLLLALALLGLALPASAQTITHAMAEAVISPPTEPKLLHVLITGQYVLQGFDLASTEYLIGENKGREANPFLKGIAANPGAMAALKMGAAVGFDLSLHYWHKTHPKIALLAAALVDAEYLWVVHHNLSIPR